MKILLVAHGNDTHPLGLADIYHFLQQRSFDVDFVHIGEKDKLSNIKYIPDWVGITAMTRESVATLGVVKEVKNRWSKTKIVLGGKYFTDDILEFEKDRLIPLVNHIVIGEGEYAIQDLILGVKKDKIIYGEQIGKEDYLELPLPDEAFIRRHMSLSIRVDPYIRTVLTRGCPFSCTYCSGFRCPVIRKEPDVAAWYIKKLARGFNNRKIFFLDDVFTVGKKWLKDFSEEYRKQKLNVKIKCFIHGRMFDEEIFDLLLSAGVDWLCLGAESGDDNILKLIDKKCKVEDYLKIDKIIKTSRRRVKFECLWMIGNIGETARTMRKTVELSKRIGNMRPWFSFAIPFPGSVFWKQVKQYGKIVERDLSTWRNTTLVFVPNGTTAEEMRYWRAMGMNPKIPNLGESVEAVVNVHGNRQEKVNSWAL